MGPGWGDKRGLRSSQISTGLVFRSGMDLGQWDPSFKFTPPVGNNVHN